MGPPEPFTHPPLASISSAPIPFAVKCVPKPDLSDLVKKFFAGRPAPLTANVIAVVVRIEKEIERRVGVVSYG